MDRRSEYVAVGLLMVVLAVVVLVGHSSQLSRWHIKAVTACRSYYLDYVDFNDLNINAAVAALSERIPWYFSREHAVVDCYPGFAVYVRGSGSCGRGVTICNLQADLNEDRTFVRCVVTAPADSNTTVWAERACADINAQIRSVLEGNTTTNR